MGITYDNWERLVAAVLRREQLWQLCHQDSRSPSLRSTVSSSDSNSSFRLSSSFSRASFDFTNLTDESFTYANSFPFGNFVRITRESKEEASQLVLFTGTPFAFDLQELLMAPSFLLGDEVETFGTTYIIRLQEGMMLVAKRLQRGNFTHEKFKRRLEIRGTIEHENVVKLRGYYLSEDESLGFYDYFPQGSVYTMLYGKTGENRVQLDWEARIKIAIGAAKGLLHIHKHSSWKVSHGNIKASNIFLNSQQYGCISDTNIGTFQICNYHPPEVSKTKRLVHNSDVYSFGVLLIELLSGKSPLHFTAVRHKTYVDWAIFNARDYCTALLFDKGLLKHPVALDGMWDMLAVALSCVKKRPEDRPNMEDVVKRLEHI